MIKKLRIIICLILVVSLATGCTESVRYGKQVEKDVTEIMELIKEGKEDELYDCFSEFTQNDITEEELKKKIHEMYTFIDGNITEYSDYNEGSLSEEKSKGKVILYYAGPSFDTVKTDNGNEYEFSFGYYLINDEDESELGLCTIHIYKKGTKELVYGIIYE